MARTKGSDSRVTGPRIRQAALRLFAAHGYAAVSMRQIAGEVGVQAGALYQYVPDKQTLLFELINEFLSARVTEWRAVDGGGEPADRLRAFVDHHIRHLSAAPEAGLLAELELRNLTPDNARRIGRRRRAYEAALSNLLEAGQAEGALQTPDAPLTATGLLALLNALVLSASGDEPPNPRRLSRLGWRMVQRMVRAKRVRKPEPSGTG